MKNKILLAIVMLTLLVLPPQVLVSAQEAIERPVVMISSYATSTVPARGENFSLSILLHNSGKDHARNIFIEFVSGELLPRDTGGIQTLYQLNAGETKGLLQPFTVSPDLWGATLATVTVNLTYSDTADEPYTDSFTITIDLSVPAYAPAAATATPTVAPVFQSQLVIDAYDTDVELLQPGTAFELTLAIANLGNADARAVSMVLGGGDVEVNPEGTPQPGISGGAGDFVNFAPLESANVKYIGDIAAGETITTSQKIIVNVSTSPGAYSLKYSFIYTTEAGTKVVDNQVITLLIYRMPALEVGFYQDPGPIFANQPNNLPLQILNLGKQNIVLGNMTVSAEDATLENATALVGAIEAGFYFTLDAMIIPNASGPLDLMISINYTDDFNQSRVYETTLPLEVLEMEQPPMEPGFPGEGGDFLGEGEMFPGGEFAQPETFWQKIGRFFKGLFGLDSGKKEDEMPFGPIGEPGFEMEPPLKGR